MRSRWAEVAGAAPLVKFPRNRIAAGQLPMGFHLPIRFDLDFFRRENAGLRGLSSPIVPRIERSILVAVVHGLKGVRSWRQTA